jgi:peptidoglycan hydrolase CwlO-like protein
MNETIFTILASAITGVVTFFIGMAKSKKEIESMSLTNLEKSIDIYARIIEDLKEEIEGLKTEIKELQTRVSDLTKENHELKQMMKKK